MDSIPFPTDHRPRSRTSWIEPTPLGGIVGWGIPAVWSPGAACFGENMENVVRKNTFLSILQVVYICLYHFGSNFEGMKWHPQWPMERLSLYTRCVVSQVLRSSPKDWRYSGSLDDAAVMGRESCCVFCLWVSLKIGCQHLDIFHMVSIWFLSFLGYYTPRIPWAYRHFPLFKRPFRPCAFWFRGPEPGPRLLHRSRRGSGRERCPGVEKQHQNRGSTGCVEKWMCWKMVDLQRISSIFKWKTMGKLWTPDWEVCL